MLAASVENMTISGDDPTVQDILLPRVQRQLDVQRVEELVLYRKARVPSFPFPPLVLARIRDEPHLFVIDGQHRLEALKILHSRHGMKEHISAMTYTLDSKSQMAQLYADINRGVPVPDYSAFSSEARAPAERVATYLKTLYTGIWTTSPKARRPFLSFTFAQEALAWLFSAVPAAEVAAVQRELVAENERLRVTCSGPAGPLCLADTPSLTMIAKARKHGCFLGLVKHDPETPHGYEWAGRVAESLGGPKLIKTRRSRRKVGVPKRVKILAWHRWVGEDVARTRCPCCCTAVISMADFEAGHITSEKSGGAATVDNILPICGGCNRSMGAAHMAEFVAKHFPQNLAKFTDRNYSTVDGSRGWLSRLTG